MAHGLTDPLEAVQHPNGRQDVGGVRALAATRFEEAAGSQLGQQGVEQELFRPPGDEPGPELAQHRVIDAGIRPLRAQGLLPVNPAAHGVGRLAIGQAFGKLHHGRQGEAPGRRRRLPTGWK